jgi:hypothetical protein
MQRITQFLFLHFFLSIASLSLTGPLSTGGYSGSAFFFKQTARVLTIPARQIVQGLLEPSSFLVIVALFLNSALWTLAILSFYKILRVIQKRSSH